MITFHLDQKSPCHSKDQFNERVWCDKLQRYDFKKCVRKLSSLFHKTTGELHGSLGDDVDFVGAAEVGHLSAVEGSHHSGGSALPGQHLHLGPML